MNEEEEMEYSEYKSMLIVKNGYSPTGKQIQMTVS